MTELENKLFKVSYADGHEVYFSDNVLYHPNMTKDEFFQLVEEAVNEIRGEVLIDNIEEYLINHHGFKLINCLTVNTRGMLTWV